MSKKALEFETFGGEMKKVAYRKKFEVGCGGILDWKLKPFWQLPKSMISEERKKRLTDFINFFYR